MSSRNLATDAEQSWRRIPSGTPIKTFVACQWRNQSRRRSFASVSVRQDHGYSGGSCERFNVKLHRLSTYEFLCFTSLSWKSVDKSHAWIYTHVVRLRVATIGRVTLGIAIPPLPVGTSINHNWSSLFHFPPRRGDIRTSNAICKGRGNAPTHIKQTKKWTPKERI